MKISVILGILVLSLTLAVPELFATYEAARPVHVQDPTIEAMRNAPRTTRRKARRPKRPSRASSTDTDGNTTTSDGDTVTTTNSDGEITDQHWSGVGGEMEGASGTDGDGNTIDTEPANPLNPDDNDHSVIVNDGNGNSTQLPDGHDPFFGPPGTATSTGTDGTTTSSDGDTVTTTNAGGEIIDETGAGPGLPEASATDGDGNTITSYDDNPLNPSDDTHVVTQTDANGNTTPVTSPFGQPNTATSTYSDGSTLTSSPDPVFGGNTVTATGTAQAPDPANGFPIFGEEGASATDSDGNTITSETNYFGTGGHVITQTDANGNTTETPQSQSSGGDYMGSSNGNQAWGHEGGGHTTFNGITGDMTHSGQDGPSASASDLNGNPITAPEGGWFGPPNSMSSSSQ